METSNTQQYTCLSAAAGLLIHCHRQLCNTSQVKYAKKYDISHTALLKIEKCQTLTSLSHLEILASLIGCTGSTIIRTIDEILLFLKENFSIEIKPIKEYTKLQDNEKADLINILNEQDKFLCLKFLYNKIYLVGDNE